MQEPGLNHVVMLVCLLVVIAAAARYFLLRRVAHRLIALAAAFPALMGVDLWLAIHGGCFYSLLAILVFLSCIFVIVVGTIVSVVTASSHRPPTVAGTAVLTALYIASAMLIGFVVVRVQYDANEANGTVLADAIARYHTERGQWPAKLDTLEGRYLSRIPMCWCGPYRLQYDYTPTPWLGFSVGSSQVACYHFDEKRWTTHTLGA